MIRYLLIILACFYLTSCAAKTKNIPGTNLEEKVFQLPKEKRFSSTRSLAQLSKKSNSLKKYINQWPPNFRDEVERQEIYGEWLDLVSDAEALKLKNVEEEANFAVLSELYRQGHNMDVKGSAKKAMESLDACLSKFPQSVACHFSATYLYLHIGPKYLDSAEKSLETLKKHFAPKLHSEVEKGYAFLYLFRRDVPKSKAQIDKFLKHFPDSSQAKDLKLIKENLGNTIEYKKTGKH
jgi:tetratricopeptide (TPR) repeat protein